MKFTTTLNQIRECEPCGIRPNSDGSLSGWLKLLNTLGKTKSDDEPLSLLTILDSNGLDDALWSMQAVKNHDRDFRLFAVWAARQVQHLMEDPRSLNALDVAEQFANGLCDDTARAAAWDAAGAAAWAAARAAARASARASAGAAARAAAWDAAGAAAWAAARAAAWDSAGAAAGAAAWAAQDLRLRQLIEDGEWIGSTAKIEKDTK